MKYIVTGGCGFIGSNLVRRLVKDEHEVVVIDNLSTGSLENLKPHNFEVIKSIEKIWDIKESFNGIFHLGIPSSTTIYRENRNLIGEAIGDFVTLLEYAKEKNLKIVYSSSSSIYNGNEPPFKEGMPVFPLDFYTEVRYSMERLAKVYNDFYGVKSIGLRLFSVYGDNEQSKGRYANLVSQILWAKESGETFDIYNEGKTLRDFIHVDDAVEAFILAMNSKIDYDIINIGTGKDYSINDIIKAIGLKNYRYVETPIKNYVDKTLADVTKAKEVLGFNAKTDVIDYIKQKIASEKVSEHVH